MKSEDTPATREARGPGRRAQEANMETMNHSEPPAPVLGAAGDPLVTDVDMGEEPKDDKSNNAEKSGACPSSALGM